MVTDHIDMPLTARAPALIGAVALVALPPDPFFTATDRDHLAMTQQTRPRLLRLLGGIASTAWLTGLLGACAAELPRPYHMEVVQGNVVTQEMVAQLKTGMTRDQVRNLMGSPMLADIFHAARWDYVFSIRRQGATTQQRRVTVYYEADKLARFEAGELPTERDFVASIDAAKPRSGQESLELTEAQLRSLPLPVARTGAAPAPAASGPLRTYPPLETVSR
jgi:outer membrane protein assembly factor BamE